MSLFYLKWVPIQKFRGSQKIIIPLERKNPSEKAFNTLKKSIESSSASIKRARTHVISLHWNGNALSSAIGFGGKERHEVFRGHLVSFTHLLCNVWNVLSVTETLSILPLKTHGFFLSSGQCTSKCIRAAFESTRYVVTRLKAFCLPLLTGSKQTIVVLVLILILSLLWELLENTYLKSEMQEASR